MGLLTILLLPLAVAILGITGVGLLVVPFVLAAVFFGALIGRVALLEWLGLKLGHQFGAQNFNHPVAGLLLDGLLQQSFRISKTPLCQKRRSGRRLDRERFGAAKHLFDLAVVTRGR